MILTRKHHQRLFTLMLIIVVGGINNKTRGPIKLEENKYYINAKKPLAEKFAIYTSGNIEITHVKLMSDNAITNYGSNNMS